MNPELKKQMDEVAAFSSDTGEQMANDLGAAGFSIEDVNAYITDLRSGRTNYSQEFDRDRQAGRFLLTGSANVMLLPMVDGLKSQTI
jgi:hypothetical protein